MRKFFLIFFLTLISGTIYAQDEMALSVSMHDGTVINFFLKEKPCVSFVSDSVEIVSSISKAKLKRSQVRDIKFTTEPATSISEVSEDGIVEISGEFVCVENMKQGCNVLLLTTDGRVAMATTADENGVATLSLTSLPKGIYLLNYNNTTIKFVKP